MGIFNSIGMSIGKIVDESLDTTVNTKKMEEEKMDDVRIAKFETLIEDIDSAIKKSRGIRGLWGLGLGQRSGNNTALALIFEYNKCNEYAKAIMDKSTLSLNTSSDNYEDVWRNRYPSYESFSDAKDKITAAKDFVKYCRQSYNVTEGYKFIFWALLVLSVDKSEAEEHLSLICDFAQMLHISDAEFEDVIQTVKIIYNKVETEYIFKSENIPSILGSLFNLYGNQDINEVIVEE